MIRYDVFNRSWVDTRWQQHITQLHTNNTHNTEKGKCGKCGPCPVFAGYTLAFALQLRKKHGKASVRVSKIQDRKISFFYRFIPDVGFCYLPTAIKRAGIKSVTVRRTSASRTGPWSLNVRVGDVCWLWSRTLLSPWQSVETNKERDRERDADYWWRCCIMLLCSGDWCKIWWPCWLEVCHWTQWNV
jgi:hypothetical protein